MMEPLTLKAKVSAMLIVLEVSTLKLYDTLLICFAKHLINLACSDGTLLYNIWGLVNCTPPYNCKDGYGGQLCNECVNFHHPFGGYYKTIDSLTGEGVKCICKFKKDNHSFTICIFLSVRVQKVGP